MNGQTPGQILLSNLSKISFELASAVEALKKIENINQQSGKEQYEFKIEMLSKVKEFDNKLQDFGNIVRDLVDRMNLKDDKIINLLNDIKNIKQSDQVDYNKIETILNNLKIKISEDCADCQLVKVEQKWSTWLKWALAIVGLGLLAVLGLNLFGYISLPGIG